MRKTFVTLTFLVACPHRSFPSLVVVATEAANAQWQQHTKVVTESHCVGAR